MFEANEISLKDSNEFVRKIYSSTPDQSMFLASGGSGICAVTNSNNEAHIDLDNLDEEDELYDEENDEHEVSIHLEDSPKKPCNKPKIVNRTSVEHDDQDDTLSDLSDSEFDE